MRYSLTNGFEMKRGFGYLVPVQQKIRTLPTDYLRYSPKSSTGRDFLHSRLLTDFMDSFNEVADNGQRELRELWLFLTPLAFDLVIGPGMALGQTRIFEGVDTGLTRLEMIAEYGMHRFLRLLDDPGYIPQITPDGMQLHLDLQGEQSNHVVGLRARRVSTPIDLRRKHAYDPLDFFEPLVTKDGRITIRPREHYLLVSHECFAMPGHLNAELRDHSQVGLRGPIHYAGFIDPGFSGQLVFEITVEENSPLELSHRNAIGGMILFQSDIPDKVYGVGIGSHYAGQLGPRVSKRFTPLDTKRAAKQHEKLSRPVLVQDAKILHGLRTIDEGFEFSDNLDALCGAVEQGMAHVRYECERDTLVLQPIPYVVFFGTDGRVFTYKRAEEEDAYGEKRLFGKLSLGVGGHIKAADYAPDIRGCVQRCLERELREEVSISGKRSSPHFFGTLFVRDDEVDTVHFGLVYGVLVEGSVHPGSKEMQHGAMVPIDALLHDADAIRQGYGANAIESWTQNLIAHLPEMYKRIQR